MGQNSFSKNCAFHGFSLKRLYIHTHTWHAPEKEKKEARRRRGCTEFIKDIRILRVLAASPTGRRSPPPRPPVRPPLQRPRPQRRLPQAELAPRQPTAPWKAWKRGSGRSGGGGPEAADPGQAGSRALPLSLSAGDNEPGGHFSPAIGRSKINYRRNWF